MPTCPFKRPSAKALWIIDLLLLTLGITLLFAIFLGSYPLGVPDEARYAEIPREMIALGNYLTPHLNYIVYFEKPVLFYWIQVGAIKLFGLSEWAVRLPTAFMGLLGCLLVYSSGRLLYDRRTGLLASIILATSVLYFAMAHIVTLDMTFSVLFSSSLFAFLIGAQTPTSGKRRTLFYSAYILAALAVLTKGLIGIFLPMLIVGVWLLLLNEWRSLKNMYLLTGVLLFLLIAAPWHILVQLKNPEFWHFYFIDQHFMRYFTTSAGRYKPVWFFIPVLLAGFLPWTLFLVQAIASHVPRTWSARKQFKNEWFLLLWALLVLLFFSFSDSKLVPYILPVFPPLAILIAHYFSAHWLDEAPTPGIKDGYAMLTPIIALLTASAFLIAQQKNVMFNLHAALNYIGSVTIIWTIGAGVGSWLFSCKKNWAAVGVVAISTAFAFCILLKSLAIVDIGSIKSLAITLKPLLKPNDTVVSYQNYHQDLPYYLQRRITVVDARGELEFGMQHQNTSAWMINAKKFWPIWFSKQRVYMLIDKNAYTILSTALPSKFFLIGEEGNTVLVENQTQ